MYIKKPKVRVTRESENGRNEAFQDTETGRYMTRDDFVRAINHGSYENEYHVRKINGIDTPVSNPDKNKNNNLG